MLNFFNSRLAEQDSMDNDATDANKSFRILVLAMASAGAAGPAPTPPIPPSPLPPNPFWCPKGKGASIKQLI